MNMDNIAHAIGLAATLAGLALLFRCGLSFRRHVEFTGAALEPDDYRVTPEKVRDHQRGLKGRLGFFLVVFGTVVQAGAAFVL